MRLLPNIAVAAAILGAVLAGGCRKGQPETPAGSTAPAAAVRTAVVTNRSVTLTEDASATVRARVRAIIEAKTIGHIQELHAVPGRFVKKDDLLAQLAPAEAQARFDQTRAVEQQTRNDLDRVTALVRGNVATPAELDAVQSRHRVAQAALAGAQTALGYTRVLAPFDGVVTRKFADPGDLAAPGKPLVEIEQTGALRIEADVPESMIANLALGQTLRVTLGSNATTATVSELPPAADPASRTVQVKLDLPPGTTARSGQFARLAVPVSAGPQIRVPAAALLRRGQMEIVFVARDGQAILRLVKSGKRFDDEIEILSGLEPGESIIMNPPAALRDGQPFTVSP
jgi:RND family efflux transporter MFP subunit